MTNKDAFRSLRTRLLDGTITTGANAPDDASATAEILTAMSGARLIAIAGMDRMELGQEENMPREVNFVSPNDFSMSLNGPAFLRSTNVSPLAMKDDRGRPIRDYLGGHAQESYVSAICSSANKQICEFARDKLGAA